MKLVCLDTETTGVSDDCDIWEIGLIARTDAGDVEYCWRLRPSMWAAEPTGLRISRYYERIGVLGGAEIGAGYRVVHPKGGDKTTADAVALELAALLDGATILGAVPDFDTRHLSKWLAERGQCGTWRYHLVDVETLAAGALRLPPPWNFDDLLGRYGLSYDEADRHTALGDARLVRDLYDAVMNRPSSDEG